MPLNKEGVGSDVERDASRVTSLPPARVHLPIDSPVVQVACGLHHTGKSKKGKLVFTPFWFLPKSVKWK